MASVIEVMGLDGPSFREWVSAERSRLPGSSEGFASFLAVLRMLRPVEVVWVSDGREPEQCGYSTSSVGRLILEVLSVGSRLVWSRVDGSGGLVSHEFRGVDGVSPGSSFSVICVPGGYDVRVAGGGGLLVRRLPDGWSFSWEAVSSSVSEVGGEAVSVTSSNLSTMEMEGDDHDGRRSGDKGVGDVSEFGIGGGESGGTGTAGVSSRGKVRRSRGD